MTDLPVESMVLKLPVDSSISTIRFPHGMVLKAGDSVECKFTMHMDVEDVRAVEAVLLGTRDGKNSHAEQLARILDTLEHLTKSLPVWDECNPRRHVRRAMRELTHAMLALETDRD
jgi:hypothetical protein